MGWLLARGFRCRWLRVAVVAAMLPAVGISQETGSSAPSSPPPEEKKKTRKVWTEDDLRRVRGRGVSVVGESPRATGGSESKDELETDPESGVLPEDAAAAEGLGLAPKPPPCKSKSWGAAVNLVLAAQGVDMGAGHWLMKCYGGDVCTTELGSVAALARSVEGDYVLDDGSKLHIQAEVSGVFPGGNAVALADEQGRSFLVVWKKHPYVLSDYKGIKRVSVVDGMTVVEYILSSVTLMDSYEGGRVTLKEKSDLDRVDAVVTLVVTKR